MKGLVRGMVLVIAVAFGGNAHAFTLGEFLDTMNGADQQAKADLIHYIGGVMEALLYANEALIPFAGGRKPVCFPSPIPPRASLTQVFRNHVQRLIEAGQHKKAGEAKLDQVVYASWMHTYPCR